MVGCFNRTRILAQSPVKNLDDSARRGALINSPSASYLHARDRVIPPEQRQQPVHENLNVIGVGRLPTERKRCCRSRESVIALRKDHSIGTGLAEKAYCNKKQRQHDGKR